MKTPVLETRRQVMAAVSNAFPGGMDCAAARLGIKDKRLENQIYETAGCKPLSDTEIFVLESETKTELLPDYICAMYGGVFVKIPEARELDNVDLYQRSLAASAQRGALDQMVASALEDGEIDSNEAKKIRALHAKYMSASLEAIGAVIELHKARA
ncbi:YmfL family putative regulatory protein [Pseudomonas sp. P9_2]|uniref:YmfL family putative regulatory protein n=1 Tax=Pseudomonas sp. P9_2 TaxID=3043447 RepID=UPI002A3714B1|nr:YmfL family putative regulatory protein [Pseudomonas sp. P9_2]WPN50925.1 YmfL family putative regulatory protein [Pseudomonas sp. P9_2]